MVASTYAGTLGVPALFHRSVFDSILKIDDEHGAKKVIESNESLIETVDFPGGAIDIDTPEDLVRLKSRKPDIAMVPDISTHTHRNA